MTLPVVALIIVSILGFAGIMWWGRGVLREHPIRAVAVLCVAIIGGYVMWMGWLHTNILASADWCSKAIQAERITPGNSFQGLTACIDLLKIQVEAEATNSHIYAGSAATVLVALIVIVIAQGRAQISAPGGLGGTFGPASDPATEGANKVAKAAVSEAKTVAADAALGNDDAMNYNGPAMPEPGKE